MDFSERIILALVSALIGFFLSQFINIVKYFRKPKFRVRGRDGDVISSYTGNPPETPTEVELGFTLENYGKNPAKNTRIFISELRTAKDIVTNLDDTTLEFTELRRPVDIIPSGEAITVVLGKISSDKRFLEIPIQNGELDSTVNSDTRGKNIFAARFHIYCDDPNSSTVLNIVFDPSKDEWASILLRGEVPSINVDA